MFGLLRLATTVVVTAVALYLVTEVVPGINIIPADDGAAFVWIAILFMAVNAVVGPLLRLVGLPLSLISYALTSLAVNAALLWITEWISIRIGLGLTIDSLFSLVAGAAILAIALWALNTALRLVRLA